MAFSFTKYFKKDSSGDPGQDSSQVQSTSVEVSQEESSQPSQSGSYSGIGNPPQGQAYSGIGNPQAPNQTTTAQKTTVSQSTSDGSQPAPKTSSEPSSIDMGKRVGMDVLSRLTQRANAVLMKSVDKVKELKGQYIDTEHILWGLLHDSSIYQLISDCKVVPSELQAMLEKNFKKGKYAGLPQFSPRVKRVLELSLSAARSLGYEFISPEHILLALSQEGEGVAAQVLTKFRLTTPVLNQKITGKKDLEHKKDDRKTTALEQFTEDLTAKAARGELDPVVGRSGEIERIIHILSRRTKNNPALIGDAGVGKTAIVEGLAQRIARGDVPETLLHKRVLLLDLMSLIAGARHRGEFEERLKNLIKEVKSAAGAIILFIDELHNMVGAGSGSEGTMDASNILKPSLARGELQVIGTTTVTEYRKYIEKDPALERRFQPVTVAEPSAETAIEMVTALRDKYEAFHRVKIPEDAIEAAVRLSQRYISDRYLPDKAVDLIDEASAAVRLPAISLPEEIKSAENKLKKLNHEFEEADKMGDAVRSESIKKEIEDEQKNLEKLQNDYQLKKSTTTNEVNPETIAGIVSRWTNIPVSRLTESEAVKLMDLEKIIHKRLIDQEEAVSAVAEAVRRGRAGLKSNRRPIGSFIFMGPTGVGKTELAKSIAEILFGSEEMMVRLDMSEYMEKHEVAKLIGAPPGYVGYEEGGQLTEAVRRRPYSVVLLDEIEKAHPDVFNILIQLLDDGRLTDNKGRTISFKNSIVICTSNLGSSIIQEEILSWGIKEVREIKPLIEKARIFKTFVVSPTGREMLTLDDLYFHKDPQDIKWKKGFLKDYFAGSIVTGMSLKEGEKLFPEDGLDTHTIAPDGSETITSADKVWFRTSTTGKEWRLSSILDQVKGHIVINAMPDKPDQQLPTAQISTHAFSLSNQEIITLGNRFWKRDNLQIKDWTTGSLMEYFANGVLLSDEPDSIVAQQNKPQPGKKDDTAHLIQKRDDKKMDKTEPLQFPVDLWDIHLFKPTGDEIIIFEGRFYMRINSSSVNWKAGPVEKLFSVIEVELPKSLSVKKEKPGGSVKVKQGYLKGRLINNNQVPEHETETDESDSDEKIGEELAFIPVKSETEIEIKENINDDKFEVLANRLMEELRKFFRPELLNRYDEVVIFRPLTKEHMLEIVDLQMNILKKQLYEQNIAINVTPVAKAYLTEIGFDPVFGARPLRRTIQREIENPISTYLIKSELAAGDTIDIDYDGQKLLFNIKKMHLKTPPPPPSSEDKSVDTYQCKNCGHEFEVPFGSPVSACPKCQSPAVSLFQPPPTGAAAPPVSGNTDQGNKTSGQDQGNPGLPQTPSSPPPASPDQSVPESQPSQPDQPPSPPQVSEPPPFSSIQTPVITQQPSPPVQNPQPSPPVQNPLESYFAAGNQPVETGATPAGPTGQAKPVQEESAAVASATS